MKHNRCNRVPKLPLLLGYGRVKQVDGVDGVNMRPDFRQEL